MLIKADLVSELELSSAPPQRGSRGVTDPLGHVSPVGVVVMILQHQNGGDDRQANDHHGGGKVLG